MSSNDRYAYAVGRVRAMETRLLDRGKIDRMVEAKNAEEALKILGESEYAEYVAELGSVFDYEQMLKSEQRRIFVELRKIIPNPIIIGLFAKKFDYHNLKVLFKANKLQQERAELLIPDVGNIPVAELVRSVNEEDYSNLPPHMRQAAQLLTEQFRLQPDPQLVDIWLDRAMYADIIADTEIVGSPFLTGYFKSQIDLINIKTFIRIKRLNLSKEFLEEALLPGGDVNIVKLAQLVEPLEVLIDRLAYTPYGRVVEEGIESYQKTDTLTRYEKLADDFLVQYTKQAKYITFGLEPIIGYLLAKENELKMIRIVMVGKINELPVEEIKERLRDVYV